MLRKLAVFCAAATALLAFGAAPAAAGVDDFTGQWTNQDTSSSGVTRVSITRGRGVTRVRVYGRCHPTDCDWGEVDAVPFAPSAGGSAADASVIMARYDLSLGRKTVIIRLNGANLAYEVFTDFNDARADYLESGRLRPLGIVPRPGGGGGRPGDIGGRPSGGGASLPAQDCIGFANGRLTVERGGAGSWRVVDGDHSIIALDNVLEANRAVQVIRNYGFTQQCFITRPGASMTYWTRGSNPPRARMPGDDCIAVDPTRVQARNVGGSWKVVDGDNWLLDFAANRAGAEAARDTIRYYNLGQQCFVGRPGQSMQYWLAQ